MIEMQPNASHFINGAYVEDEGGAEIALTYPATGEKTGRVFAARPDMVAKAVRAAEAALPVWSAMTGAERGRILTRAAQIIRERNRDLSILETLDTGKPLSETLVADAASGADCLEYFGGMAATITGETVQLGADFAYTIREPLGVCAGIGAWNYPIQIACWKAAPALACGNTMVFKPSEETPLTALKLAEILVEAGAPPGVFNVIQGAGETGAALVDDPRVAKVSLTGSVPTGRKVYEAAARDLKHVTMELGGKSPLIIFDDANVEDAVSAAINANFYSTGQICSNGTRVFVQTGIKQAFLTRLAERTGSAVIGDPMDEATHLGPMVSEGQRGIVLNYIAKGLENGARLITGGKSIDGPGYFIEPTVFADVTDDMAIAREEIFGPVMSVLDFETEEDVTRRANDTEFGLAAGVFTRDLARAHRMVRALQAGTCWINQYNLTPIEMPFGGVKASGIGRENARAAIEAYSQPKSVYVGLSAVEAPF
ncbi:betaine-aldehyde dehydrogenase [Roseibacterium beibuensis]|uniref:Betaine-aldehyde dehydrogenase n=1 Tax=[Roseibacterium] beibuensis TaxID=1193142 RepID=A0ABP9KZE9_9RHOB|nr:betaine-aldehyde dehydrogenase [Roseibacterium beibuensis]MCS6621932.1 betaine-aldehyde dehydrogenase [Roseibacterium beibuensis]